MELPGLRCAQPKYSFPPCFHRSGLHLDQVFVQSDWRTHPDTAPSMDCAWLLCLFSNRQVKWLFLWLSGVPTLDVLEGGLQQLMTMYKDTLLKSQKHIIDGGEVQCGQLEELLHEMGRFDKKRIENRYIVSDAAVALDRLQHQIDLLISCFQDCFMWHLSACGKISI